MSMFLLGPRHSLSGDFEKDAMDTLRRIAQEASRSKQANAARLRVYGTGRRFDGIARSFFCEYAQPNIRVEGKVHG
jgi:hypothetical protein